jgi:protein required for attachment to host cells
MRQEIAWVLMADSQRACVLERRLLGEEWRELEAESQEVFDPPSRALGSERPGRTQESVGRIHHAIEPRQDLNAARKVALARDLADRLETAAEDRRFARLIIVAPPGLLGHIRGAR